MSSRFLPILLAAVWLAGCAVAPPPDEAPSWDEVLALPPDQAWERTREWSEEERTLKQFELLRQWADLERWIAVSAWLPEFDASALDPAQRGQLRLIQAQALLHGGEELAALTALSTLPDNDPVLKLRAQIYDQLGDPENALRVRLSLAARPGDASERDAQHRQAWGKLLAMSRSNLTAWRDRTGDATWQGWLELALLARPDAPRSISPKTKLEEWKQRHEGHPAFRWLPALSAAFERLEPDLRKLAALIPVSGDFAPIGRAIRVGIETGMRQHSGNVPELRIYDTGDPSQTPTDLYRQAVADGAQRIIGPFDKDAVTRLVRTGELPVDTISLNYLETYSKAPGTLYQFGLLPEDEAAQAAERALAEGRRAAVVFAPAGTWGQRLDRAFTERFEAGGGTVRGHGFYFANASDHAAKIKDILKLSEGEMRRQKLEEVLGREVISRPTRRQDIDMVFLASSPHNARLFKPQLDFYYAGDLPLYATSHIYTGTPSPLQDQDLEGALFCDIPLVLDDQLRAKLGQTLDVRRLPRFAALGADAYLLAMNLDYLKAYPEAALDGWTGGLSLREGRRVFRTLDWARFTGGRPLPAPEPERGAIAPRYRTQN